MKKRLLAGMLALVLMFSLTGCGGGAGGVQMNEDGSLKTYTEEEIPEGLFIKSGNTYYPLLNATEEGSKEKNFQWFTEFDHLIPELKEGDTLILYSNSEVPENFTFWKMLDFGYTVGIRFVREEKTQSLNFPGEQTGYCSYSPVGKYILETHFQGSGVSNVRIKEVNGKEFKETMLTADGFMKGLTKDAMYKFWYYKGTVYKSVNVKADTHVFIEDYDLVTASYVELKDKAFEVNLPNGIENGYWFIDGYGMFKYSGPDTDLILDPGSNSSGDDLISNITSETPSEQPPIETPAPETQPPQQETTPPAENPEANPEG